jgi:hypothetical protein
MTDLLSRLAALTQKKENGLLPCPFCLENGQPLIWRKGNEHTKESGCDVGCVECGFTKSIRVIRYSLEWAEERAVAAWNSRPRESALIALVQEAAGEIERVSQALHGMLDMFDMCGTVEQDEFERKAIKRAKQALSQQEAS